MRKLIFVLCMAFSMAAMGASLEADIGAQGKISFLHKTVTAQQLATMVRDHEDVTAVGTLLYTECGKTIFLNSATAFALTLPLPVAGCYFKFIVKAAPAAASYTVVTSASANILIGGVNELEVDTTNDGPYDADGDTITFADGVAAVGDYVEMISDGTSWYITGQANLDGGITVTKAS